MWGTGLYDSDEANDLKDRITQISKLPFTGDKLLTLLLDKENAMDHLDDWDSTCFWLVVADQFERKGIVCEKVRKTAQIIIQNNLDLNALEQAGLSEKELTKRQKVLEKLQIKLNNPKPARKIPTNPKPPKIPVAEGEIYVFPTMASDNGFAPAFNAHVKSWEENYFIPNSWGALVILATGYLHDYLPWAAYVSLRVPYEHKANLDEAIKSKLYLSTTESRGPVWLCHPKKQHLERMQAEKIGQVALDSKKATQLRQSCDYFEEEVFIGRAISSYAYNLTIEPSISLTKSLTDMVVKK